MISSIWVSGTRTANQRSRRVNSCGGTPHGGASMTDAGPELRQVSMLEIAAYGTTMVRDDLATKPGPMAPGAAARRVAQWRDPPTPFDTGRA